jgi:hypothetical protein
MGAPASGSVHRGISYVSGQRPEGNRPASATLGGMLGYTLILADIFVGSAGIGVATLHEDIGGETVGRRQVDPRFRLSLGFAW